jgi:putative FmdB family regulatory protein
MPIYDYVCHHCGHRFEVIHGLHDSGPSKCPVCHSNDVRKAFAPPAIHFKGSGWAKKDRGAAARKSKSGGSSESGDTAAAGASSSGDGSSTGGTSGSGSGSSSSSSSGSSSAGSGSSSSSSGGSATD